MKLYNSLTKKKEEFIPVNKSIVKMYTCGPTVYYYPHIGNMRAYIFMDSLRRVLKYNGYDIKGVMNITDVGHLTSDSDTGEDKMELSAKKENKSPYEVSKYYTEIFFNNLKKLNVDIPEHITKATEYIDKMIDFIKILEEKGYTYMLDDGLYFDVKKFKRYGMLSNKKMADVGVARIVENVSKHHSFDFALWKRVEENHIMKWDSPWGVGCPGWHIECSVMSNDILGDFIDIHTGGVDHKTIHHENEIAQNDCAMGHKVVNYWMHCEFLQVDGGKMSKSLNNIYTIEDLESKGYSPCDFKYFCLNTHYGKIINFTFEGLTSARNAIKNLKRLLSNHKKSNVATDIEILDSYEKMLMDAINDDLNIPLGLGILWKMLDEKPSVDIYNMAVKFNKVFGLEFDEKKEEIPKAIMMLAKERWDNKVLKNFAKADAIRNELLEKGYVIEDNKDDYIVVKK